MAADKFELLQTGPVPAFVEEQIDRLFTVHKLHKASDREAFFKEIAPKVRAIISFGAVPISAALMQTMPNLEIVGNFGVGYDSVDAKWAGEHGIVVTNTPGVLDEEVADTTLGLLLNTVRQLPQSERYLRAGKWLEKPFPLSATLRGRKVGIVGMGRIGKAIARRIEALRLPVVYHSRRPAEGVTYRHYPNLVAMARDIDVLIVIVPGGAATKNMINREVLEALGPNGVLINVARGSVVDEPALIEALRNKKILSAGLDVFADEPRVPKELIDMDHVVLLPHVGSASVETRRAMGQLVVDNLKSWAEGKGPITPVPETPWPAKKR
ncbi:MAG TPA: 2-hydroxyacid dehydrogenase [Xanthobacteraceae bacterium]|jgi:lactate dehydrogenase-like 2-hydroxyacid dehydrogenase